MAEYAADDGLFDEAADAAIALGNRLLEEHPEADAWEIAEGLLAGAVHFWLYAHQPCGDPLCESCVQVADAASRVRRLLDEVRRGAEESSYYHTPTDRDVGNA